MNYTLILIYNHVFHKVVNLAPSMLKRLSLSMMLLRYPVTILSPDTSEPVYLLNVPNRCRVPWLSQSFVAPVPRRWPIVRGKSGPRTLFEVRKMAGSARCKQSKTVCLCCLLRHKSQSVKVFLFWIEDYSQKLRSAPLKDDGNKTRKCTTVAQPYCTRTSE